MICFMGGKRKHKYMKLKVIQIGNSRGVRLPHKVITSFKNGDFIEIEVITSPKVITLEKNVITPNNVITKSNYISTENKNVITKPENVITGVGNVITLTPNVITGSEKIDLEILPDDDIKKSKTFIE